MKKNEQVLSDILKAMFRDEKTRQMYYQTKIEKEWRTKMGTLIDRHTNDILLNNRILYIKITSASLRQELTYSKAQIIEFANTAINEKDYISQVVIM